MSFVQYLFVQAHVIQVQWDVSHRQREDFTQQCI